MNSRMEYQPCWCGSQKSLKDCHAKLSDEQRPRPHEYEEVLRKKLKRSRCMAPSTLLHECDKQIVSAHTISRTSALNRIARGGHVFAVKPSFKSLDKSKGRVEPTLVGVKEASTFNGFCKLHDSRLFKEIDGVESEINYRFCLEMAFRSIAKELFLKQEVRYSESEMQMFEMGADEYKQRLARLVLNTQAEVAKSAERDLTLAKDRLDAEMLGGPRGFVHHVFELSGPCSVLLSSCLNPEWTPQGELLQNVNDISAQLELVMFSSVPREGGMAFILSAHRTDALAMEFVGAVADLPLETIPRYLTALVFEKCENFAISPDWWDSCSSSLKKRLIAGINRGVNPKFGQSSETKPLELGDWKSGLVLKRVTRICE